MGLQSNLFLANRHSRYLRRFGRSAATTTPCRLCYRTSGRKNKRAHLSRSGAGTSRARPAQLRQASVPRLHDESRAARPTHPTRQARPMSCSAQSLLRLSTGCAYAQLSRVRTAADQCQRVPSVPFARRSRRRAHSRTRLVRVSPLSS